MSATDVAFWVLAAVAILSGWRVFRTDSMVRASFLLLLSFVAVGLIMLLLRAPYLGIATLFMMAVEMMVMAVFMVMFMMNPAGLNPMNMVHQHTLAIALGVLTFVALSAAVLTSDLPQHAVAAANDSTVRLGRELMGGSMLVFETVGVTLLTTMIGTVVLSSRSGRYGVADAGSLPPGLEPGGAPAGRQPEKHSGGHHMHMQHGESKGHGINAQHDQAPEQGKHQGHDHGGSMEHPS